MDQQVLIPLPEEPEEEPPEPAERRPRKKKPDSLDDYTLLPCTKYGEDQLPPEEEGYVYIKFDLYEKIDFEGKSHFKLDGSSVKKVPLDMHGSAYGLGLGDEENLPGYFHSFMEQKKDDANDKYWKFTKEQSEIDGGRWRYLYYEFRLIPITNWFVIIPDKMIEYLKTEHDFDFEAWYQEFQSIEENAATKQDFERGKRILKLIDEGEKLSCESRVLLDLNKKLDDLELKGNVLGLFHRDDLTKKMREVGFTLYKLDQQIINLRKTLRTRRYLITGDVRVPREFGHQTDYFGITCESGAVLMPNIMVEV